MGFLGLSDEDYIRVGVGVIVLSGAFITAGIYMWNKRRKEKADRENDRPGMAGYSPGVKEKFDTAQCFNGSIHNTGANAITDKL